MIPNNAHGTMVSSIINAKTNNAIGMTGLAPECRILTASYGTTEHILLKLQRDFKKDHPNASMTDLQKEMANHQAELAAFGKKWTEYISRSNAEAIRFLVDSGVRVINISGFISRQIIFGSSPESWDMLQNAFTYARDKGVIIVLGSGNNAREVDDYPGDDSFTIIAGASLLNDTRWEEEITMMQQKMKQGSSYGKRLTVMSPVDSLVIGVPHEARFYSCDDGPMGALTESKNEFKGMYEITRIGGTSSAAPIVTALVALVYSLRPDLDAKSVVEIVKKGCDDIGEKGFDIYTGYGRVNYGKTLELAKNWKK
ncbi:MAG: S8 family peptidase [Candidatus Latescibacterota bacterium]